MLRSTAVILALLIVFSTGKTVAQEPFTDFYDFREKFLAAAPADRQGVIDQYISWQNGQGFPAVINDTHAVFVYYTSTTVSSVKVPGDMNGWDPNIDLMTRLDPNFNFFFREKVFEPDARLDYKFVVGSNWILDPRNPNRVSGGFGPNSEIAMPQFVQSKEIEEKPTTPKGSVITLDTNFPSANPTSRIYLPNGYDDSKEYPSVYFADGGEYINLGSATTILDNMIHKGEIDPVIAVFSDPYGDRANWYNCSNTLYIDYLDKLVNFVDANYATNQSATSRAHIGTSLGGQISAQVGVLRNSIFKTIGAHSPAWYDGESISSGVIGCGIKQQMKDTFANGANGTAWWMTAGSYEQSIWDGVKEMEPYFNTHGVPNKAIYLHEGHSWGAWRHTLDDFFRFWFSPKVIPENNSTDSSEITSKITSTNTSNLTSSTSMISSESMTSNEQSSSGTSEGKTSASKVGENQVMTLFSTILGVQYFRRRKNRV